MNLFADFAVRITRVNCVSDDWRKYLGCTADARNAYEHSIGTPSTISIFLQFWFLFTRLHAKTISISAPLGGLDVIRPALPCRVTPCFFYK